MIKSANYVLTKDFTLKMLNIHERKECGMPVIIEGETGVGKTFLVEVLSQLWNEAWKQHVCLQKEILRVSNKTACTSIIFANYYLCNSNLYWLGKFAEND